MSPTSPLSQRDSSLAYVASASATASVLALVDSITTMVRSELYNVGGLVIFAQTFALYLPVGIIVGLLLALLRMATQQAFHIDIKAGTLLAPRPRLLLFLVCLATAGIWVGAIAYQTPMLLAVVTEKSRPISAVALAVGALLSALPVSILVAALCKPVIRKLPKPFSSLVALVVSALVLAGIGAYLMRKPLTTLWLIQPAWISSGVALSVLVLCCLLLRPKTLSPLLASIIIVFSFGTWWLAASFFPSNSNVRGALERKSLASGLLLRNSRRLLDADGDGFASHFGGGDCDDSDAMTFPGAGTFADDEGFKDCVPQVKPPKWLLATARGGYSIIEAPKRRPNIFVLSLDGLRADYLGPSRQKQAPKTPHFDAFSNESTVFDNAYAASSRTVRSLPAAMSGKYSSQLAMEEAQYWPEIKPENQMLAEVLSRHRYDTGILFGTDFLKHGKGYTQGFKRIHHVPPFKANDSVMLKRIADMIKKMDATGKPWFAWAHLMTTHAPYVAGQPNSQKTYNTTVKAADVLFGKTIAAIREIDPDATIILTADHGEGFGEHDMFYHSNSVYNEAIRVPLIVYDPDRKPAHDDRLTSLIDLMPTVLHLAGINCPIDTQARSLFAEDKERPVFSEVRPDSLYAFNSNAIIWKGLKLIHFPDEQRVELFDVKSDPHEIRNLSEARPADSERLYGLLTAYWRATASKPKGFIVTKIPKDDVTLHHAVLPGLFVLRGSTELPKVIKAGQFLEMDLYIEVLGDTPLDLTFTLNFYKRNGTDPRTFMFDANHIPAEGQHPSTRWRTGQIFVDRIKVVVPSFAKTGEYDVEFGVRQKIKHRSKILPMSTPKGQVRFPMLRIER